MRNVQVNIVIRYLDPGSKEILIQCGFIYKKDSFYKNLSHFSKVYEMDSVHDVGIIVIDLIDNLNVDLEHIELFRIPQILYDVSDCISCECCQDKYMSQIK